MAVARLYGFNLSHPTLMVRAMLDEKGIEYELVTMPTGLHPVAIRALGFRGGTVPALRLADGRRVQTTRRIARALDSLVAEPRLSFSDDAEWVAAEAWADEEFQNIPRMLWRRLAVGDRRLRRWIAEVGDMPLAAATSWTSGPLARLLAAQAGASDERIRAVIAALPATMDRVDALLTAGTARVDPPDALALQLIVTTKTLLVSFPQLGPILAGRRSSALAAELDVPLPTGAPASLPQEWLGAAGVT